MLIVETIRKIRHAYHRDKKSLRQIARDFNMARNTVKKVIRSDATEFTYTRTVQPRVKLADFEGRLHEYLTEDRGKPVKHRRSAQILFEQLQRDGFTGGYDSVRRHVRQWRAKDQCSGLSVFIPLSFEPGEAFQFDWSYEDVELGGMPVQVKVAQFRLCHSRMPFCVAYTREALEMVLDAHVRAFEFYGGSCQRGIYDNLKSVVTKVLMGKDRVFTRRFQSLASHYLFEPVACTPAAGWEKGQIEKQVGTVRQRFFNQRRKFAGLEELNQWLADQCRQQAAQKHPELRERTIAEVFREEQSRLVPVANAFDGYVESPARVSRTALVSFDRNCYSVQASAVGKPVTVRAFADRVMIVQDSRVVGVHRRHFGRDKTIYDPWHYLEVLKKKPGALRNGAPFKEWDLPEPLHAVRQILTGRRGGDRQFVDILASVAIYGVDAVAAACAQAQEARAVSRDVVLNLLSRSRNEPLSPHGAVPAHLPALTMPPLADCQRYDLLLSGGAHGAA
jgi:transposase